MKLLSLAGLLLVGIVPAAQAATPAPLAGAPAYTIGYMRSGPLGGTSTVVSFVNLGRATCSAETRWFNQRGQQICRLVTRLPRRHAQDHCSRDTNTVRCNATCAPQLNAQGFVEVRLTGACRTRAKIDARLYRSLGTDLRALGSLRVNAGIRQLPDST